MKSIFSTSFVVAALLVLDSASLVTARRNGTASLARRTGKHHGRRSCSTVPTQPTSSPSQPTETQPPSTPTPTPTPEPTPASSPGPQAGTVSSDFQCDGKSNGATTEISQKVGPNGEEDWLNCGLSSSPNGWNPPPLKMKDIVYVELEEALKDDSSPYHACAPYLDTFNKYAQQFDIPAIFIAAFALQESSCNPNTVGGAGEQGMMQITVDKCINPPNGNCLDVDFNVGVGAKYFADSLAELNGNVLETVGRYNGWYPGLTEEKVRSVKDSCCFCQQNMDYMMEFFNGWLQNKDAYSANLGYYHNYGDCGK
ncbi:lysozyme-like protein [Auriculariales sp. MPI-PUGE-AT-0066]|nr:lysozyme-like protein [Auriculariales sp. MPI-PUGE-AT-0066]